MSRTRRAALLTAAVAVLVTAIGVAVWADGHSSSRATPPTSAAAANPPVALTTAPTAPATSTSVRRRAPTFLVAYDRINGTTVALDLAHGTAESLPVDSDGISPTYAGPADGRVYMHRSLHPSEVVEIDLDTGAVTKVDDAGSPALSADGRLLAYVAGGGAPIDRATLVVRDLTTGGERRFDTTVPADSSVIVSDLSWSADGRALACRWVRSLTVDGVATTAEREIRILDLDRDTSLEEATRLGPSTEGVEWRLPTFRGRFGTLAVVEQAVNEPDPPARILAIDPITGEVVSALLESDRRVVSLDADDSGHHLLYTVQEAKIEGVSGAIDFLYQWSGNGPQLIAEGLSQGAWQ